MSTMIQIRNVPDDLHRKLKARAALAGMTLSDYLLAEIRQSAEQPTMEEFRQRLASRSPTADDLPSAAQIIREERDRP
jgi:plasmid stability protein